MTSAILQHKKYTSIFIRPRAAVPGAKPGLYAPGWRRKQVTGAKWRSGAPAWVAEEGAGHKKGAA